LHYLFWLDCNGGHCHGVFVLWSCSAFICVTNGSGASVRMSPLIGCMNTCSSACINTLCWYGQSVCYDRLVVVSQHRLKVIKDKDLELTCDWRCDEMIMFCVNWLSIIIMMTSCDDVMWWRHLMMSCDDVHLLWGKS